MGWALVRAVSVAGHCITFLLTLAPGAWARAEGLFLPPERVARSGIAGAVAPAQVTGVAVEGRPVLFFFLPDPSGPLSVKMAAPAEPGWSVSTVLAGSVDRNVGFFDAAYVNGRLLLVVGIIENQNTLVRVFSAPPSGEEWTPEATANAIWDFGFQRHASIVAVGDSVYAAYQDRALGPGKVGILERKGGLWSAIRPDMESRVNPSLITGIVSGEKPHFLLGTDSRDPLLGVLDGDSWRFSVIPGGDLPVLFLLDGRPATVGF